MACIKTFDNSAGSGLFTGSNWSTNGTIELIGYSTTIAGTYGPGGNWPWNTNSWGVSIDTSSIIEGFYKFKYKSTLPSNDPCYGEIEFIIPIVQGAFDFPNSPVEISLCSGDSSRNIFNDSGLFAVSNINPVNAVIGGSGISAPGYTAGNSSDITDDTFDPSQETSFPITRSFEITYTPQAPSGYTLDSCENCDPRTIIINYNVSEAFQTGTVNQIAICNDGNI